MQIKRITSLLILLMTIAGFSQETSVKASLDTASIRIGEQLTYKITVDKANGKDVIFPKMKNLQSIEVVGNPTVDSIKNRLVKTYILTSFDSGRFVIPAQKVFIDKQKKLTDSLLISVLTVKVDTTKQKMYPIKAIKKEPKILEDYLSWLWFIIPILLIIIGILLYVFLRKKKTSAVFKKKIPPMEEAMTRLQQLDTAEYLKNNELKKYYTELTDIVRTYIERGMHIPALESTTNELIETITDFNKSSNLKITSETLTQLKLVLQNADLVKFAKSKPLISEAEKDRMVAEQILQNIQAKKEEIEVKEDENVA